MKLTGNNLSRLYNLLFRYGCLPDTNDPKDAVVEQRVSQLYMIAADLNARIEALEAKK